MKRASLTLVAAVLVGMLAFSICYFAGTRQMRQLAAQPDSSIAWLVYEFHLKAEESAKVQSLQKQYEPVCMEMCRKIAATNARLDQLISNETNVTPELEAVLKENVALQAECHR